MSTWFLDCIITAYVSYFFLQFNANLFIKDFNQQLPLSFLSDDKKWKGKNKHYKLCTTTIIHSMDKTSYVLPSKNQVILQ